MITRSWPRSPVITTLFIVVTVLLNSLLIVCDNSEQGGIKEECDEKDPSCSTDKLSLEAINELHHMIDDDQDGNVNQQESKGFLKEELQYTGGSERVAIFHNNDSLISVDDLWKAWMKSDVYNWTVDDVVHWLESHVHLPQYSATFRAHNVIGRTMPRLAITKGTNTLKTELGIKNGIHRQKISVQAMDLVLFGPPKDGHNVLKDIALILSTFFVVGVSWFAYSQNKRSKCQLERMLREMENLQKADDELKDVQNKLTEAEELQLTVVKEKTKLEMKYQDEIEMAKKEAERLKVAREGSIEEISRLKLAEEELVQVRGALKRAEKELERSQWVTPAALRNWLQLTYEIELDYFNRKKLAADIQFKRAREEVSGKGSQILQMMAFSKSISKGQFPINCELCESNPKIQWKCKDCNLLMCQTCRDKIHPKFKNANKHQICDIKEIGPSAKEGGINMDFSNIPCQKHKSQDCCLFCKACNILVCATCVSTIHNGHTMGEIKEFYENKMIDVRKRQTEVKINERRLKENELTLAKINKSKSESYNNAKQDILDRKTALTKAVAKYADQLLSDLHQDHQSSIKAYDEEKENIQNIKLDLNKQSSELEGISSTTEAATFFKEIENLNSDKKDLRSIKLPGDIVTEFVSGEIMQSNFGSLQKMKRIPNFEIMLEISKEFRTESKHISLIAADTNNSLWLSDHDSSLLQKVKLEGNNLRVLHTFNIEAFGLAVNNSNDLLLCTGHSGIKKISNGTNQVNDSINIAPLEALCSIHITKEKIIVTLVNENEAGVIVMDLKGKQQAFYHNDSDNKPIFKLPLIVTSTDSGNICVVDLDMEANNVKLIVLGTEGKVINTYEGRREINTKHPFKCVGVAKTPRDNIIVSDPENHLLHILDSNGNYITHYKTEDMGILYPWSLAFSTDEELYIGCNQEDDNAKLYKVNFYEY
ncbi:stromal interaction molecule 1 [Mytilus galloprovincialis]|uniref:Stromal interaction molecule 1 n=1 Tax=Mytilus galloprovincialis TaxID=29158 RepID=A0A8B6CJQ8_MYTGA|nr:stromal interaction molecule 1 [Mytilus galloprovincialis]